MTRLRHDPVTQALHWAVALAILASYAMGLAMEDLRGPAKAMLLGNHMSAGMVVLVLTAVRLAWRPMAPKVAPIEGQSPLMDRLARLVHLALYVGMAAIPLIGLMTMFAKGRNVEIFGLVTLVSPIAANRVLGKVLEEAHEITAHLLVALAGLHAAAAIAHQLWLRDGTLGRMLPFLPASPAIGQPAMPASRR